MTDIVINLSAGQTQQISESHIVTEFSMAVDINSNYVYVGNIDVSIDNYWKKIPGGGRVSFGESDLSEVYLLSEENAKVTVTY